jgi:hypothetical protein
MVERAAKGTISDADVASQWRLLALQTRRLALFLKGTGHEDAMRRAEQFERAAKELEEKAIS